MAGQSRVDVCGVVLERAEACCFMMVCAGCECELKEGMFN